MFGLRYRYAIDFLDLAVQDLLNILKTKIAFIITRSDIGGAQNHVLSLLKYFCNKYDVVLLVGSEGFLSHAAAKLGVDVRVAKHLDSFNVVGAIWCLRGLLNDLHPDFVHSHSSLASFYGRLAAAVCRIPVIYTVHGWHFSNLESKFRASLQVSAEWLFRALTRRWITVSQYDLSLGNRYLLFNRGAAVCIPNGIPDTQFLRERTVGTKSLKMVFVGRATYQKNYLDALSVLQAANNNVQLTFYTSGKEAKLLESQISDRGLTERCTLILDETDAGSFLNLYDLMIVTSRYEGMPLSVLEGLRASLPIVSTDVCGMSELVDDTNGFLSDVGDIQGMAMQVDRLDQNRDLLREMGIASRKRFERDFLESFMLQKTWEVYSECGFP